MFEKIPTSFLNYAAGILGRTSGGLSGSKIVEYCNAWAVEYNVDPPHSTYPFDAPNKQTALQENLAVFPPEVQYKMLLEFCGKLSFPPKKQVKELRAKLEERFGPMSSDEDEELPIDIETDALTAHETARAAERSKIRLRVFLCHARDDKPKVRELYGRLKEDDFDPWLDEEDLLPGEEWQLEIPRAVRNSHVVLVCLSKHSILKSGYVQERD